MCTDNSRCIPVLNGNEEQNMLHSRSFARIFFLSHGDKNTRAFLRKLIMATALARVMTANAIA